MFWRHERIVAILKRGQLPIEELSGAMWMDTEERPERWRDAISQTIRNYNKSRGTGPEIIRTTRKGRGARTMYKLGEYHEDS